MAVLNNAELKSKYVEIHINRDPVSDNASLSFVTRQYLYISGTNTGTQVGANNGNLFADSPTSGNRNFGIGLSDPYSGEALDNISLAGVLLILDQMSKTLQAELPHS